MLYALTQSLYGVGFINGLIAGRGAVVGQAFNLPLLGHPVVFLLDIVSSCGLCLGMVLLVVEEYRRTEYALRESVGPGQQMADNNAALLAEISARKQVEQALQENEDRYRDLVEHSEDLLCTHDLKGRLLFVNPAPVRVLGYEVEELLQMSFSELLAPRFRNGFDAYVARIQRKGVASGLMTVLTRSGEERTWEYHNTLRTEGVPSPIDGDCLFLSRRTGSHSQCAKTQREPSCPHRTGWQLGFHPSVRLRFRYGF